MLKKRCFILILTILMIFELFGCANENLHSNEEYIFLPETELHTRQSASGSNGDYKYTYEYDSYGNIVNEEHYTKGLFYLRDSRCDTTYTYDENGKIIKKLIRDEHFSTKVTDAHFVTEEGYNYFYNESGQLIQKEYIYITYIEDEFCGYQYEYDQNGNCIKEMKHFSDGTEKLNVEYIYDSSNKLIKKRCMEDLNESINFVSEETDYSYDDKGKLIYSKRTFFDEQTGEIRDYKEYMYFYDEQNRLVKEESALIQDGKKTQEEVREYKDFIKIKSNK